MVGDGRRELWGALLDGLYRLGEPLGCGATGVVLRARRLSDGREVAIKMLRRELAHRADLCLRLRREAEVARAVRHPGVVSCLAQGELPDGSPYVVFERLSGESLLRLLRRRGPLPVTQALAVARRVSRVLSAVHGAGYVHRDLKSEHVWLSSENGALQVALIDFGVCQPPDGDAASHLAHQVLGTPGYLAPEQAAPSGPASARSDLYGLGATLFEALTGRPPYAGPSAVGLLRLALSEDAAPLGQLRAEVPRAVERLVQGLLSRAPESRPLNARVVERALSQLADTPLARAEAELALELRSGPDAALVQTLDEGRPTRTASAPRARASAAARLR
jgi:serine/threonine-protein kinase